MSGAPVTVVVASVTPAPVTVAAGVQGPPGPPGLSGRVCLITDKPLGGHRLVRSDGVNGIDYADCTDPDSAHTVLGMTAGAALAGGELQILRESWLIEASWNWTPNRPVYLGVNGLPTQTLPASAVFSLIVGFPVAPTKLFVVIREPIFLL